MRISRNARDASPFLVEGQLVCLIQQPSGVDVGPIYHQLLCYSLQFHVSCIFQSGLRGESPTSFPALEEDTLGAL